MIYDMKDRFGRTIEYMRISVTDRCNLRCRYCMPNGCEKLPMSQIMTYEEITRVCEAAAGLGISRIRITGGEPFVRPGCTDLIRMIRSVKGIEELTVTTNGQILDRFIEELKDIGIDGINISLDTLKADRFRLITGGGTLQKTLDAIELAASSGIRTKINCLPQSGFNEDELTDIASIAWDKGVDVRFIEMMPIGAGDPLRGISNESVIGTLMQKWGDLEADDALHGSGPAVYFRRPGISGAVGLISAIHGPFCCSCNRIRLTSTGQIKPCLCYEDSVDIRPFLHASETELKQAIREAVRMKPEAHCFTEINRGGTQRTEHRLMSQIGG